MNRAEFKAIMTIAEKLGWTEVNFETISQMIRNQQSLELDTVGECDDDEMTLLSLATCSADKIVSTLYVSDYFSLADWCYFLEQMNIDGMTAYALLVTYDQLQVAIAEKNDLEEMAMYDAYCDRWENSYC